MIAPDGSSTLLATPNLPVGGDTGVESLGFVPPKFSAGGRAYIVDRGTADNFYPGTDSILRLSSDAILLAGVREGELVVVTEGGATRVAVHCEQTCAPFLSPRPAR